MNKNFVTVADVIEFFKSIPPDTKIRVKEEITRHYDTYTQYVEVVQYDGDYKRIDGIEYNEVKKTVHFLPYEEVVTFEHFKSQTFFNYYDQTKYWLNYWYTLLQ